MWYCTQKLHDEASNAPELHLNSPTRMTFAQWVFLFHFTRLPSSGPPITSRMCTISLETGSPSNNTRAKDISTLIYQLIIKIRAPLELTSTAYNVPAQFHWQNSVRTMLWSGYVTSRDTFHHTVTYLVATQRVKQLKYSLYCLKVVSLDNSVSKLSNSVQ